MSQRRSDLHTLTNFFIYIFPPNLYWHRLDVWKCENSHWPPCYFLILPISESFDTVAFVRIRWCSCRVFRDTLDLVSNRKVIRVAVGFRGVGLPKPFDVFINTQQIVLFFLHFICNFTSLEIVRLSFLMDIFERYFSRYSALTVYL